MFSWFFLQNLTENRCGIFFGIWKKSIANRIGNNLKSVINTNTICNISCTYIKFIGLHTSQTTLTPICHPKWNQTSKYYPQTSDVAKPSPLDVWKSQIGRLAAMGFSCSIRRPEMVFIRLILCGIYVMTPVTAHSYTYL